jgi:hypothetical protein
MTSRFKRRWDLAGVAVSASTMGVGASQEYVISKPNRIFNLPSFPQPEWS